MFCCYIQQVNELGTAQTEMQLKFNKLTEWKLEAEDRFNAIDHERDCREKKSKTDLEGLKRARNE
jgi:hypothetical protein